VWRGWDDDDVAGGLVCSVAGWEGGWGRRWDLPEVAGLRGRHGGEWKLSGGVAQPERAGRHTAGWRWGKCSQSHILAFFTCNATPHVLHGLGEK
jgi:hypothetical protein